MEENTMGNEDYTVRVIKRNGEKELLDISKIRKQTEDACNGLTGVSFEELEIGAGLYLIDGIKTSDIQNSLIETALRLNSMEKPNYIYVAGRLSLYDLYHELQVLYGCEKNKYECIYDAISIKDYINTFRSSLGDYCDSYSDAELEELNKCIDPKADLLFSYPAVSLLKKTYLNRSSYNPKTKEVEKDASRIIELPQHMFMLMAMFNCSNVDKDKRIDKIKELYTVLSKQYFIPATPHLSSARTNIPSLASCLVTSAADNLDSISRMIREVMFGSSDGAGLGIDISRIRSLMAPVRGLSRRSKGKVPLIKTLDSVAFYIDQAGKRPGAFSVTIRVWDTDLQSFLNIRKAQGEERLRARNIHPAVAVDDVFMSRVKEYYEGNTDITYTVFNPYDVPDLCDTYGEDFKSRYLKYEAEFLTHPEKFCPGTEVVKVKDVFSTIITSIATEHYPYVTYIDTVNKANPHPEFGPIRCGNLCVHGDTLLTTDLGVKPIRELLGQYVNAWNGTEFSCVEVADTGRSAGYEVILENGPKIVTTPEHIFRIYNSNKDEDRTILKQAMNLSKGDIIEEYFNPAIDLGIALKTTHKEFKKYLKSVITSEVVPVEDNESTKYYFRVDNTEADKIFATLSCLGIGSRIVRSSPRLTSIYVHIEDLVKLKKHKLTNSPNIDKLDSLTYRLDLKRYERNIITPYPKLVIQAVNKLPGEFQSYCATEHKHNQLTFNGVVTKNCQEVMLPADEGEMAVCNLGSINMARVYEKGVPNKDLLLHVTKVATEYLDRTIDITTYPTESARITQEKIRSIGLGVVGEAECIAHMKIHYGSEEHEKFVDDVYSSIRSEAHKTSIELAKELGACEALAEPAVRNGYLMCIAPNTNTGIFASTTSGCEPVFGLEWLEDHPSCGSIRLTAPNINLDNFQYYKHGFVIDPIKMINLCAARQKYIDMSISFSLFLKTDGISGKWLGSLYLYAWEKGVKSMYYIRSEGVTETVKTDCENCAN